MLPSYWEFDIGGFITIYLGELGTIDAYRPKHLCSVRANSINTRISRQLKAIANGTDLFFILNFCSRDNIGSVNRQSHTCHAGCCFSAKPKGSLCDL